MTTPTDLLESLRTTRDALRRLTHLHGIPGCECAACHGARALAAADLAIAQAEQPLPAVTAAVVAAMHRYGGRFVGFLAETWHVADPTNRARLESAFPELFAQYAEVAEKMKEKA